MLHVIFFAVPWGSKCENNVKEHFAALLVLRHFVTCSRISWVLCSSLYSMWCRVAQVVKTFRRWQVLFPASINRVWCGCFCRFKLNRQRKILSTKWK